MADGFIIKRGSLGGTKQVDSLAFKGIDYGSLTPLRLTQEQGLDAASLLPLNDTKTHGTDYNTNN
jgi:hypothetical protein